MFNFAQLLSFSYWFSSKELDGPFLWILLSCLATVLLAGIIIDVLLRFKYIIHYRVVFHHISSLLWTMSLIGIIWILFFYEGIYILSARIWFILWFILAIIWAYFIFQYYKKLKRKYSLMKKNV